MKAVYKSDGATHRPDDDGKLNVDQPSVISLQIPPESVASFERRGDDLVLVLRDGREVTVHGFFRTYDDGRNDLVLEDDAGVLWWGQYHSPWSEFHFTEIEWLDAIPLIPLHENGGLLAGVGALALAAAAGGGGGGSSPNMPPEAPSYRHSTPEDQPLRNRVIGSDPDGDPLGYALGTPPAHGTVIVEPDGSYTYTPDPDYNGADSFTVIVDDGRGGTTTSTVDIDVTPVDDPVVAADDSYTVAEDTPLVLDLLANDDAPDGGLRIVTIAGVPLTPGAAQRIDITEDGTPTGTVIGTLEIDAGGTITLVPALDYNGPINFDYTAEDADGDTDTATVSINVTPVNDPPRTVGTIADQSGEDAQAAISLATAGAFTDVEGDTLTYSADNLPAGLSIDPSTGLITGDIHPSASQGGAGGVHSVVITATDPLTGQSAGQEFTWTVTNPSPVANDDTATTAEDIPVSGNVLTGSGPGDQADTDPDGDELELTQFTVGGSTYSAGQTATIAGVGTLRMDADGDYEFIPAADWNGPVPPVTYTVSDREGGTDTAQLTIDVTAVNDDPVIQGGSQSGTVIEAGHDDTGTALPGTPSVTGTFTATDVDNDATDLVWSIIGTPDTTYGSFGIDPDTGAWSYTLDNSLSATQALNEGDTVNLSFTVQVSDGSGGTAQQTVEITIEGTNDAPVAIADTESVKEAGVQSGGNTAEAGTATASGNVLDNDTDVDDGETDSLQIESVSFGATAGSLDAPLAGTFGSLEIDADGNYVYTLDNSLETTQALARSPRATASPRCSTMS